MYLYYMIAGMIRVAWSSKSSKIMPINIGTFSSNVKVDQPKFTSTTCWTDAAEDNKKTTVGKHLKY